MTIVKIETLLAIIVITTLSAWITAFRMRRRIRKALGVQATETELTSIGTWIRVNREEQRVETSTPIIPR
jgi:hypothetical protein